MNNLGKSWRLGFAALVACVLGCVSVAPVKARRAGSASEKILYSFCSQKKCVDGQDPNGSLIELNGTLYGTTGEGGDANRCGSASCGTVFSFNPRTGVETVHHAFCTEQHCPDGANPAAGLIAVKGKLY